MIRLVFGAVLMILGVGVYFLIGYLGEKARKIFEEEERRRKGSFLTGTGSRRRSSRTSETEGDSSETPEEPINIPVPLWARLRLLYSASLIFLGFFLWATTSFVIIPGDKVGHLEQVFTGEPMEPRTGSCQKRPERKAGKSPCSWIQV